MPCGPRVYWVIEIPSPLEPGVKPTPPMPPPPHQPSHQAPNPFPRRYHSQPRADRSKHRCVGPPSAITGNVALLITIAANRMDRPQQRTLHAAGGGAEGSLCTVVLTVSCSVG